MIIRVFTSETGYLQCKPFEGTPSNSDAKYLYYIFCAK